MTPAEILAAGVLVAAPVMLLLWLFIERGR